jgi:hypothetical protein
MSDEKKSRWRFWPEMWCWKICDTCLHSHFNPRARFCADCGRELRISNQPRERMVWLGAWIRLAFYLWIIEAVLLGMAEIDQTGGFDLFAMLIPAGAILAAFALVLVWRQTGAHPVSSKEPKQKA